MLVRLEVAHKRANIKKIVLKSDTVIGRGADCNLRIASKEVSRRHCSILISDTSVFVRDLDSSNGTFVDGTQIEANTDVPLSPGCRLSIGDVGFVVQFHVPGDENGPGSTIDFSAAKMQKKIAESSSHKTAPPAVKPVAEAVEANGDAMQKAVPINPSLAETTQFVLADSDELPNDAAPSEATREKATPDSPAGAPSEKETAGLQEFPKLNVSVAADETISMDAEELLEHRQAEIPTVTAAVGPLDAETGEEEAERPKRWSLFGLFKRKRKVVEPEPEQDGEPEPVEVVEAEPAISVEPANVDTAQILAEETLFDRQNTGVETPSDSDDSSQQPLETIAADPDLHSPAESEPAGNDEEDDPALGDFLSQLP